MEQFEKIIQKNREAVANRIRKSLNIELQLSEGNTVKKATENEIEKAVYEDNAANRKLGRVGQEYGKKSKATETYHDTLKKNAANALRENLQKIANSDKYPEEVRRIAKEELKTRLAREKSTLRSLKKMMIFLWLLKRLSLMRSFGKKCRKLIMTEIFIRTASGFG
nr:MAG TPA: hypothetical protein [Caudoviricetes sp.]